MHLAKIRPTKFNVKIFIERIWKIEKFVRVPKYNQCICFDATVKY